MVRTVRVVRVRVLTLAQLCRAGVDTGAAVAAGVGTTCEITAGSLHLHYCRLCDLYGRLRAIEMQASPGQ